MSRIARILGIIAVLMLVAACSGGGGDNSPTTDTNSNTTSDTSQSQSAEPALPLDSQGTQLVARVNGEEITLQEFERAFRRQQLQASAASYDALASDVVNTLIEQRLINQAAAAMGIAVTDEEVDAEYQSMRSLRGSDGEWQAWLDQNLYTADELRASLRDSLITQRALAQIVQTSTYQVTEAHARHIVVDTEDEANAVLARLNAGEDFAAVALDVSKDVTSRENGGDLGWFTEDELLVPEVAQAAFAMQLNEIRGPIQSMLGYHVIQLLELQQRAAAPEEEYTVAQTQFNAWLESLLNAATIERFIN